LSEGRKGQIALDKKAYLPPEYREKGQITPKLNVFAVGMVVLEVVTSKKAAVLCEKRKGSL